MKCVSEAGTSIFNSSDSYSIAHIFFPTYTTFYMYFHINLSQHNTSYLAWWNILDFLHLLLNNLKKYMAMHITSNLIRASLLIFQLTTSCIKQFQKQDGSLKHLAADLGCQTANWIFTIIIFSFLPNFNGWQISHFPLIRELLQFLWVWFLVGLFFF